MNEPYASSPVASLAGHVPEGGVALVLGRPGVGKTALLVHAALGALFRGEQVLHLTLSETVDHVRAHYDEMLRVIDGGVHVDRPGILVERGRMIHSARGRGLDVDRVGAHLDLLADAADFRPTLVVVDGLHDGEDLPAQLEALAAQLRGRGVRCWASVHSEAPLPAALFPSAALVVRLVPEGPRIRMQRVHGDAPDAAPALLEPSSLLVVEGEERPHAGPIRVQPGACTLYTGGAAGAEAAFGEVAAKWGLQEVAFTFEGHLQERAVGRYELSPRELAMGDVSLTYVSKRLNRSYNDRGGLIRGVLQTLWHMVSRSRQVFVIGIIQQDGTVRGGTGWGVELARMWSRELWVFDLERGRWHRWEEPGWAPGAPVIHTTHICGTGTRKLSQTGQQAIETLFQESFGDSPAAG